MFLIYKDISDAATKYKFKYKLFNLKNIATLFFYLKKRSTRL